MSVEICEVCFIVTDGTLLGRNLVGLQFDLGILGGYHLDVDMRANSKKAIKYL